MAFRTSRRAWRVGERTVIALPAVASSAIAPLLRGGHRDLRVLAAFPQAAYLSVGEDLVALVTSDGIRQPDAVVLNVPSIARPLARTFVGQTGRIGNGGVRLGDLEISVSRWWDPTPRLRATTPARLRAASETTRRRIAATEGRTRRGEDVDLAFALAEALDGTRMALSAGDDAAAFTAARASIGLGPGLTPSGDDQLAGLIAGTLVLAPSLGAGGSWLGPVVAATQRLGLAVAEAAVGRTTSVSAALLGHAALGQLADPATRLVRAWTSSAGFWVASLSARTQDPTRNTRNTRNARNARNARNTRAASDADGDIVRATDRLLAVGSSSGRDLALGLLAAVDLLAGTHVGSMPPAPAMPQALTTFPAPTS